MPREAGGRGARALVGSLGFRLLTHTVELTAPSRHLPVLAGFFATPPDQDVPRHHTLSYSLDQGRHGRHELREEGDRFATVSSIDEAILALDHRVRHRVFDYLSRGGWLLLDAGSASFRRRPFLALGDEESGRDVFLASLLAEGVDVDGGAVTLVRGGRTVAFPLPLRLARSDTDALPGLAPFANRLPTVESPGGRIVAVDPRLFGSAWRVAPTRPTAIFVMGRAPDGESTMERLTEREALPAVLDAVLLASTIAGSARVREVSALLRSTPVYRLRVGPDARAAALLADVLLRDARPPDDEDFWIEP